jgi:hypothetical protein
MKLSLRRCAIAGLCLAPTMVVLAASGCKNDGSTSAAPQCSDPAPASCAPPNDASVDSPIPTTECIATTMRTIIGTEIQAAALGQTMATSPGLKAAVAQMASDFAADKDNLDAVEAKDSLMESPCPESEKESAALGMYLTQLQASGAAGFDQAFVTTQVAALTEATRAINEDLIGWSNSGDLKTSLRFYRQRALDGAPAVSAKDFLGDAAALGVVPDLQALQALLQGSMPDASAGDASPGDATAGDSSAGD